jgi:hypothetical protein
MILSVPGTARPSSATHAPKLHHFRHVNTTLSHGVPDFTPPTAPPQQPEPTANQAQSSKSSPEHFLRAKSATPSPITLVSLFHHSTIPVFDHSIIPLINNQSL